MNETEKIEGEKKDPDGIIITACPVWSKGMKDAFPIPIVKNMAIAGYIPLGCFTKGEVERLKERYHDFADAFHSIDVEKLERIWK